MTTRISRGGRAGGEIQREYPGSTAADAERFEYKCMEGQNVSRALQSGDGYSLMSIVAVEDDKRTVIDLREFLDGGKLVWTVPDGNWTIEEYVADPPTDSARLLSTSWTTTRRWIS